MRILPSLSHFSPLASVTCGGQGTRTPIPTFAGNCVSSAAQQTDICLSSLLEVSSEEREVRKSSHLIPRFSLLFPVRVAGLEPTPSVWKTVTLPLRHTRHSMWAARTCFPTDFLGLKPKMSAHIFLYPGWDSNPHFSRSERDASFRLGYLGGLVVGSWLLVLSS